MKHHEMPGIQISAGMAKTLVLKDYEAALIYAKRAEMLSCCNGICILRVVPCIFLQNSEPTSEHYSQVMKQESRSC